MFELIFVGIGGALGAISRFLISTITANWMGRFPIGTLLVNSIGGFIMGFIMELTLQSEVITPRFRLFLTTGLLGGLTTFSTFSYETVDFVLQHKFGYAGLNLMLNLALSFGGVILGRSLARYFV